MGARRLSVGGQEVLVDVDPVPGCSGLQSRTTPGRRSIFKGIEGVSRVDASPRKHQLMKMVESKEAQVRNLKRICRKKAGNIKALTNLQDSPVVRNLFGGMTNTAMDFLISQLRCGKRKPHGRRWTIQDKVLALALLKRSLRSYNFLRKILALPSKNTLLAMLRKVPFNIGINDHLFEHIAKSKKEEGDKYCALLFDEMDIKEHLYYDAHADRIIGFEELDGDYSSKKFANIALVFSLQGLVRNWKQPVAYYFSNGACPVDALKRCIENVVRACQQLAEVDVVCTVCEMGSTNVRMLEVRNIKGDGFICGTSIYYN